jgi:RNA polymerase-binding transcription factor DksA
MTIPTPRAMRAWALSATDEDLQLTCEACGGHFEPDRLCIMRGAWLCPTCAGQHSAEVA